MRLQGCIIEMVVHVVSIWRKEIEDVEDHSGDK
jgi:hypothetical protein